MPTTPPLLTEIASRHQAHLERLKTHNLASYTELFDAMETEVLGRLARTNITAFTRERLEQQLTAIRAVMSGYYSGSMETVWRDQISELATYEAGFEARALGVVVPTYTFALPSDTQIMAALRTRPLSVRGPDGGKLLDTFYADWTGDQMNRVSNGIRLGFAQGQTTGEIVRTLRDETFKLNRRDFETLTRTGLQHSAMVAREETWRRNSDIVKRVRIVATLDGKTSTQCFVGGTTVSSVGDLENIFRAEYSGEIVVVTTASGKKIEGTPNHPILTPGGFLPMGELDPSKHVVYSVRDKLVGVSGGQDVGVPTPIGELFDSLNKPAIFDVVRKSPTAVDFYGDGVGMDGEINVVTIKRHLRGNNIARLGQRIKDKFFRLCHRSRSLFAGCRFHFLSFARAPSGMASKVGAFLFEDCPYPFFRPRANYPGNLSGADALLKKFKGFVPVSNNVDVTFSAFQNWHNAILFEQGCNSGGSDAVLPGDSSSSDTAPIFLDHIVSVVRENRSCHVYTLGCSLGFYIANGIIVKNCRSLDSQTFPIDSGPRPPFHAACRTSCTAVLSDKFAFLEDGASRSSRDPITGKVESAPATQSYYAWLKTQPGTVQDSIVGPVRGKLLRDGGLSAQRFAELQLGKRFEPLNIAQMRELEPVAFTRAGL